MSKPEVEIDNYQAVYDLYQAFKPHPALAWVGHTIMNHIFPADVAFAEGAEEQTRTLAAAGSHFIVSANHHTNRDQYVLGSLAKESRTLHFLMGNTSIPSKEVIFRKSHLQRWGVDTMGAVPAFRGKDQFEGIDKNDRDPKHVELQRAASEALKLTLVKKLQVGHIATFEEGERNKVNPRIVQPLKRGHADIMQAVDPSIHVVTMPIGIYYPEVIEDRELKRDYRHPAVYIGRLITERVDTLDKLNTVLHPAMQTCLDCSIELIEDKWGNETILPEAEVVAALKRQAEAKQAIQTA